MDIIQSLLKIAKQKILPIIALSLICGIISFHKHQLSVVDRWRFVDQIPDSVVWIFPARCRDRVVRWWKCRQNKESLHRAAF